jgi:hypothetical protein
MTAFEIAELRAMIGERLHTTLKFWLSATMAVFAAIYYVGGLLDAFSLAAIIAFYAMMTFLTVNLTGRAMDHIAALVRDAETLIEKGGGAEISSVAMVGLGTTMPKVMMAIYGVTFVTFIAYAAKMSL